jgi:hypothetical protein
MSVPSIFITDFNLKGSFSFTPQLICQKCFPLALFFNLGAKMSNQSYLLSLVKLSKY